MGIINNNKQQSPTLQHTSPHYSHTYHNGCRSQLYSGRLPRYWQCLDGHCQWYRLHLPRYHRRYRIGLQHHHLMPHLRSCRQEAIRKDNTHDTNTPIATSGLSMRSSCMFGSFVHERCITLYTTRSDRCTPLDGGCFSLGDLSTNMRLYGSDWRWVDC